MCGHGGLLVNVVFSLTGIFHGTAGGMSSGHTWHWGTPERSHQIPLGKPGLVIPRCETLASRSVTFPLHQRKVLRCNPPTPSFSPWGSAVEGPEGKKRLRGKGERALFISPPPLQSTSLKKKKKKNISVSLLKLLHRPWDHRSPTHLRSQVRNPVLYICIDTSETADMRLLSLYLGTHAFIKVLEGADELWSTEKTGIFRVILTSSKYASDNKIWYENEIRFILISVCFLIPILGLGGCRTSWKIKKKSHKPSKLLFSFTQNLELWHP